MCSPDNPDTSRQDAVAERMQGLTEDQWNWVTRKYEEEAPTRKAAADMALRVSQAQLDSMDKQQALADESAQDYRRIYRPLEEKAAAEARDYDSIDREEQAAGRAAADVTQSYSVQRGIQERNLATMGVNPSDGGYAAVNGELDNQAALGRAGAMNNAREGVKTVGRALRADAIGVGRGVVGSQGTQAALSLTAGANAAATGQIPVQVGQSGIGMVQQGASQAIGGLQGAGNIYQNSSAAKFKADSDAASGQTALAGAALTAAAVF